MPTISYFYGISIRMFAEGDAKHHLPHIHAYYQGQKAELDLDGNVLAGGLPVKQLRRVQVWIDMRQTELEEDWRLVSSGKDPFYIDPVR